MERKDLLSGTTLGTKPQAPTVQEKPSNQKPAPEGQTVASAKPFHGKKALLEELAQPTSQLDTELFLIHAKDRYSPSVFGALGQNEIDGVKFTNPQDYLTWWKFCKTAGVNGESIRKTTGNDALLMAQLGLLPGYLAEFKPDASRVGAFGHTPTVSQRNWLEIHDNSNKDGIAAALTKWLAPYNGETLDRWMVADYQKLLLGLVALTPLNQLDELFNFLDEKGVPPRQAHFIFQQKDKRGRKQPVPLIWKHIDPAKVISMAERYSDVPVPTICLYYVEGDKTLCEQWSKDYDVHALFDWMRASSCNFSAVQVGFKSNQIGLAKALLTTGRPDLYFDLPLLDAPDHPAFAGEIIQLVQEKKIGPAELEKIPTAQWATISKKKAVTAQAPIQLAYAAAPARNLLSTMRRLKPAATAG